LSGTGHASNRQAWIFIGVMCEKHITEEAIMTRKSNAEQPLHYFACVRRDAVAASFPDASRVPACEAPKDAGAFANAHHQMADSAARGTR
jgi:hypothetical protein